MARAQWRTVEVHGQPPYGAWVEPNSDKACLRWVGTHAHNHWPGHVRWLPADAVDFPHDDDIAPPPLPEPWRDASEEPEENGWYLTANGNGYMLNNWSNDMWSLLGVGAWCPLPPHPFKGPE